MQIKFVSVLMLRQCLISRAPTHLKNHLESNIVDIVVVSFFHAENCSQLYRVCTANPNILETKHVNTRLTPEPEHAVPHFPALSSNPRHPSVSKHLNPPRQRVLTAQTLINPP